MKVIINQTTRFCVVMLILIAAQSFNIPAQKVTEIVTDEPQLSVGYQPDYPYMTQAEHGGKRYFTQNIQTDKKNTDSFKTYIGELDLNANRLRNIYTTGKFQKNTPLAVTDNFIYFAEYPSGQTPSEVKRLNRKTMQVERVIVDDSGNPLLFSDKNLLGSRFYAGKDKVIVVAGGSGNGTKSLTQFLLSISDSTTKAKSYLSVTRFEPGGERIKLLVSIAPQLNEIIVTDSGFYNFTFTEYEQRTLAFYPDSNKNEDGFQIALQEKKMLGQSVAVGESVYYLGYTEPETTYGLKKYTIFGVVPQTRKFFTRASFDLTFTGAAIAQNEISMHVRGTKIYLVGEKEIVVYDTIAKTAKTLVAAEKGNHIGVLNRGERIGITENGTIYYRRYDIRDGQKPLVHLMAYDPQTEKSAILLSKEAESSAKFQYNSAEVMDNIDVALPVNEYLITSEWDSRNKLFLTTYDKNGKTNLKIDFPAKYKKESFLNCYAPDKFGEAILINCRYGKVNSKGSEEDKFRVNYKITF